jgi:hypothetical protein
MHLRFDAASAVVAAPPLSQGTTQISLRIDRIVARNGSGAGRLSRLCILTWWDHCMRVSGGYPLMTFTRVICPVCGDTAKFLIGRDLVQKSGWHWRITDVANGDFNHSNFQCFLVALYVDLAPYASFGAAVLAGIPLPFTFGFDPRAKGEEVQEDRDMEG